MIIKMVNEFKLTVFHLCTQTRCKSEHVRGFTAGQQNCLGLRATGPPSRRGPWAAGLLLAKPVLQLSCAWCKFKVYNCSGQTTNFLMKHMIKRNIMFILGVKIFYSLKGGGKGGGVGLQ